jgi:tetratricopeptide (TPR) repeat protein
MTESSSVGYKHPPATGQFKKGTSGNPKGRRKGSPNVANLTKAALNQPVTVREGGKTRVMPAAEAIIRSLVAKGGQGDAASLKAVMEIVEMTGHTADISDDRAKNSLRLPAPFSRPELDVVQSEAREKDRQRWLATVDSDPKRYAILKDGHTVTAIVPAAIKAGDEYAAQDKAEEALAAYRAELARCKTALNADEKDRQAQHDFRRGVGRIGLLADKLLLTGEFERAHHYAGIALTEGQSPFWGPTKHPDGMVVENTTWISLINAHARMLLGHGEEVRGFYLSFKGWKRSVMTTWENVILQDFAQLRNAGHFHPLMDDIEKRLVDEGWTVQPGNMCTQQHRMNSLDAIFIKTNPDDIKSGDLLAEHGEPDRAAAVYIRNLERWHTRLKQGGTSPAGQANLQIAAERIAGIARKCLHAGRFVVAFDYVDQALAAAPDNLELLVIRALALMLRNSNDEAQAIFLQNRGHKIGDQTWEAAVAAEFQELRKAKYQHPLMDRIEKEFAASAGIIRTTGANGPAAIASDLLVSQLVQSSDAHSAIKLQDRGMLNEALEVNLRSLVAYNAALANGQCNNRVIDDRNIAVDNVCRLVIAFLSTHEFAKALEAADRAIATMPNSTLLNIYRAHALMCLDRQDEARTIYLQYRGEKVSGGRSVESLVLEDFAAIRSVDLTCPLMDKIEESFSPATNAPINL